MSRLQRFDGKTALVTGAASGIGRAAALAFSTEGARVVLCDLPGMREKGAEIENEIRETGGDAAFFAADISIEEETRYLVRQTCETFGRIDAAFNNAGIEGEQNETHLCSRENWDRVISVNLLGVWLCMKYEIEVMLKQGGGAIVNCSSIAGLAGFPGIPAYVASKHGVIGLTRTAALEFAARNIRINAVCPGVIDTPMIDRFVKGDETKRADLLSSEPIGRMGTPEEIASAVLWLCSSGASFAIGHPLVVDGGWLAR